MTRSARTLAAASLLLPHDRLTQAQAGEALAATGTAVTALFTRASTSISGRNVHITGACAGGTYALDAVVRVTAGGATAGGTMCGVPVRSSVEGL